MREPPLRTGQKSLPELDPLRLDRVVAIYYYGRGGSVFMQSLLDNHPEVVMLPNVYLSGYFDFWRDYGHESVATVFTAFILHYDVLFDPRTERAVYGVGTDVGMTGMGLNRNETLSIDKEVFWNLMLVKLSSGVSDFHQERVSRKFFFQCIHAAYA